MEAPVFQTASTAERPTAGDLSLVGRGCGRFVAALGANDEAGCGRLALEGPTSNHGPQADRLESSRALVSGRVIGW